MGVGTRDAGERLQCFSYQGSEFWGRGMQQGGRSVKACGPYLKSGERVDLVSSPPGKKLSPRGDRLLTNLAVDVISQCICTSNHQLYNLNIHKLYSSIISQ